MDKYKILYLQGFGICPLICGTHNHCHCTTCQKTGSCEEVVVVLKLLSHPRPCLVVPWYRKYLSNELENNIGGIWRFYQSNLSFLWYESIPFFLFKYGHAAFLKPEFIWTFWGLYKLFDIMIIVLLFLMMTSLTWLSLQRCEWNGWSCPPSFQTTNIPSRGDKYSVFQQTNITLLIKQLVSLRQQIIWFTSCHNFLLFLESIHKL